MKTFSLILALISASAFAQGATLVRGDSLKRREYQTYANQAFFLDPAGNDTNGCTAAGAANACLTFNGIKAKLPRFIRNAITVTVAAGTYSSGFDSTSLVADRVGTAFVVTGPAQTNITPATGTATGTFTAVASSSTDYSVVTDSTQSWTPNDLRGSFLTIGAVRYPVATNTATTISIANVLSPVPTVGTAYAITRPAAIFNTAGAVNVSAYGSRTTTTGMFSFTDIEFTSTTQTVLVIGTNTVNFTSCRITSTTTPISQTNIGGQPNGRLSLSRTYVGGTVPIIQDPAISVGTVFDVTRLDLYVFDPLMTSLGSFFVNTNMGVGAMRIMGSGTVFMNGSTLFIRCSSGGQYGLGMAGLLQTPVTSGLNSQLGSNLFASGLNAQNCLVPLVMSGANVTATITTVVLAGETTAPFASSPMQIRDGARAYFGAIPTVTNASLPVGFDGTNVTFADIDTYTPKRLVGLTTGTTIRWE